MPGLVGEMGVGGHGVDFDAQLLELGVVVSHVAQLGRADEGEVGRVEEEDGPLALQVGFGDFDELALLERLSFERLDLGVDNGHSQTPWRGWVETFDGAILADNPQITNLLTKSLQ